MNGRSSRGSVDRSMPGLYPNAFARANVTGFGHAPPRGYDARSPTEPGARVPLVFLLSLFTLASPATARPSRATAVRDTTRLGMPWTRWTTTDRFGRTITFYLGDLPDSLRGQKRPIALVIEGSGSQSVW